MERWERPPTLSMQHYYVFLILYLHLVSTNADVVVLSNGEQKLYHYLFGQTISRKNIRPVLNLSQTVDVSFGIELMQLLSMDEGKQSMKTVIWVRQVWKNELISWDPNNFDGLTTIHVDAKTLWKPDIVLYNNGNDGYDGGTDKYKTLVIIDSEGKSRWFAPATFTSTCRVDVRYFPFDIQECSLKFGSWAFDVSKIRLSMDDIDLVSNKYYNSTQWEVVGWRKKRNTVKYVCCPNSYDDITFSFILKRRPLYYVFHIIAPCIIFMLLILFSFCLPPESGERISLAITILLVFASFLQVISESLPRNSDSVPILSVFYLTVMAESALSLITTCIVLAFHHRGSRKGCVPIPVWARRYFLDFIPKEVRLSYQRVRRENKDIRVDLYGGALKMMKLIEKKNCVDCITDGDDYLTFISQANAQGKKEDFVHNLNDILGEIQKINNSVLVQEKEIYVADVWRMVGKILDRMFFYIYLITFVVSAVGTLLPVYLRDGYS